MMMPVLNTILNLGVVLVWVSGVRCGEEAEHRDFQYNSVVDPATGQYNFAYDTGHDNEIAHSLHMQYQDANGIVRGRYGYTDPRGKLRMVEYEAGPNGFVARGDVGPDQFPHGQAPEVSPGPASSAYTSGNDVMLDPAPVQMAGWDPQADPMGQPQSVDSGNEEVAMVNSTGEEVLSLYGPELGFYPRDVVTEDGGGSARELESLSLQSNPDTPVLENNDLNIYNIDIDPDDIRTRSNNPVRRSADIPQAPITQHRVETKTTPIVQQPIVQQSIDSKPIKLVRSTTEKVQENNPVVRAVYYPRYYDRYYRYYRPRQTHDHDSERYYRPRQTHDHDAEVRYYRSRNAGNYYRYYRPRQTHDHDSERDNYYNRAYGYRRYYTPRRIFYRDSHSMEPHEHVSSAYTNHQDHQHSDVQLYRNNIVPATTRPRQVQYIPSDRYHDKMYYWTKD